MAFQQPQETYKPENFFLRMAKSIIRYPFKVTKKYWAYIHGISDLIVVNNDPKDIGYYKRIQYKYVRLLFAFVYLPVMLGFVETAYKIYNDHSSYVKYYDDLTLPVKEERIIKKIGAYSRKGVYAVVEQPIKLDHIMPIFFSYFLAICGANFLSKNPTFKIQEKIQDIFLAMGCVDINGKPWPVIWTPEALLITSFGKDPGQLYNDHKFWATINFPPSVPKLSLDNMSKFLVKRQYQLSGSMVIKI